MRLAGPVAGVSSVDETLGAGLGFGEIKTPVSGMADKCSIQRSSFDGGDFALLILLTLYSKTEFGLPSTNLADRLDFGHG